MGLILTREAICPVHALRFETFSICGMKIQACPACTRPRRRRKRRPVEQQVHQTKEQLQVDREGGRYRIQSGRRIMNEFWGNKDILAVSGAGRKKTLRRWGKGRSIADLQQEITRGRIKNR